MVGWGICVDRYGCLRRSLRMSASIVADVCVDRYGCLRRPMRMVKYAEGVGKKGAWEVWEGCVEGCVGMAGCHTLLWAFFVDDVVGTARYFESFGVLLYERVDVAHALVFEYLVDGDEDARLLYVAEAVVDGGAEELHGGRERHIGVDEWRDVVAQRTYLAVEDEVVLLEVVLAEQGCELLLRGLYLQRVERYDEVVLVVEVLLEEVENHVAAAAYVRRVHGHLAEEVLHVGLDDGERTESVPQVVECEEALRSAACALVLERDEGATQLDGVGHVVVDELLGEVEHVACGELRLAVLVEFPVGAEHVAVAADDLLCLGVPHDELLVAVRAGVELVDVHRLAGAAACLAECYLAQTAYLAHHVRRVVCRDDVYLVVALVSHAELTLGSEFASEQLFADGFYDWFFHCLLFSCFLCLLGGFWRRLSLFRAAFKPN